MTDKLYQYLERFWAVVKFFQRGFRHFLFFTASIFTMMLGYFIIALLLFKNELSAQEKITPILYYGLLIAISLFILYFCHFLGLNKLLKKALLKVKHLIDRVINSFFLHGSASALEENIAHENFMLVEQDDLLKKSSNELFKRLIQRSDIDKDLLSSVDKFYLRMKYPEVFGILSRRNNINETFELGVHCYCEGGWINQFYIHPVLMDFYLYWNKAVCQLYGYCGYEKDLDAALENLKKISNLFSNTEELSMLNEANWILPQKGPRSMFFFKGPQGNSDRGRQEMMDNFIYRSTENQRDLMRAIELLQTKLLSPLKSYEIVKKNKVDHLVTPEVFTKNLQHAMDLMKDNHLEDAFGTLRKCIEVLVNLYPEQEGAKMSSDVREDWKDLDVLTKLRHLNQELVITDSQFARLRGIYKTANLVHHATTKELNLTEEKVNADIQFISSLPINLLERMNDESLRVNNSLAIQSRRTLENVIAQNMDVFKVLHDPNISRSYISVEKIVEKFYEERRK